MIYLFFSISYFSPFFQYLDRTTNLDTTVTVKYLKFNSTDYPRFVFSCGHATLLEALSVRRSVGLLVRRSVSPSVCRSVGPFLIAKTSQIGAIKLFERWRQSVITRRAPDVVYTVFLLPLPNSMRLNLPCIRPCF